jgi:RNA polymerase sigma factor (sigma-70 family)
MGFAGVWDNNFCNIQDDRLFSMMRTIEAADERFREVYEALYPLIFRIAFRITGSTVLAEDLSHEAFIKYYERRAPLPDLDQTKYWLIRVVKNLSFNLEKRKRRERAAYEKYSKQNTAASRSGEDQLVRAETVSAVQEGLRKLPFNLRTVLVLKEYSGLKYKEIARILGIREGNVKIRVFRARERLAALLKEDAHVSG